MKKYIVVACYITPNDERIFQKIIEPVDIAILQYVESLTFRANIWLGFFDVTDNYSSLGYYNADGLIMNNTKSLKEFHAEVVDKLKELEIMKTEGENEKT